METALSMILSHPSSRNVIAAYPLNHNKGIRITPLDYITDTPGEGKKLTTKQENEQFKYACLRVRDNLPAGEKGYVKLPIGYIYEISRADRTAKLI